MSLEISIQIEPSIAKRFILSGELDSVTAPQLQETIFTEITPDIQMVIIDMGNLYFLSSAGVQVIFKLKKLMKKQQGRLHMVNLQPQITKVFEIIKALDDIDMEVFRNQKEMDEYLANMQDNFRTKKMAVNFT